METPREKLSALQRGTPKGTKRGTQRGTPRTESFSYTSYCLSLKYFFMFYGYFTF